MGSPDKLSFMGKYIIKADIKLLTALHIGGTEEGFEIGGIDNPVIKDKITGVPYIPGSSLKGKMRSLLEWAYNKVEIKKNEKTKEWEGPVSHDPKHSIGIVFGIAAEYHQGENLPGPTRLAVRDVYPKNEDGYNQVKEWEKYMGDKIFTEIKTENSIDRLTSAANPRSMERVPAGSLFSAEFVYDVFCPEDIEYLKILFEAMVLLEDSALGGSGSRGSGRIKFEKIRIEARDKSYYIGGDKLVLPLNQNGINDPRQIVERFSEIFSQK